MSSNFPAFDLFLETKIATRGILQKQKSDWAVFLFNFDNLSVTVLVMPVICLYPLCTYNHVLHTQSTVAEK